MFKKYIETESKVKKVDLLSSILLDFSEMKSVCKTNKISLPACEQGVFDDIEEKLFLLKLLQLY